MLGARLAGEPIMMDDGRVGHAELAVSGGKLYLSEEFPEIGVVAPSPAGTPVSLSLQVPDVADILRRAVDSGATMPRAMYDAYGSRNATVVDPFGHRWLLHTPLEQLPETDQQGDVGYAWLTVPDPDRAAAFYAAVLGWEYAAGLRPGQPPGRRPVLLDGHRSGRAGLAPVLGRGRRRRRGRAGARGRRERVGRRRSARTGPPRTAPTTRARCSPCTSPATARGCRRTAPARATCRT